MEDQNQPCLILQYSKDGKHIIGLEVTTTYNYWEKEAFIQMNQNKLFPCKNKNRTYKDFNEWDFLTDMWLITKDISETYKNIPSTVFYPGY